MATQRATPRKTTRGKRKPAADTAEVLGDAIAPPRIPGKWQPHYQKLLAARERLTRERADLIQAANEEKHTVPGDDIADAGTDSYDRDFALSIASSEQEALFEIEEALNRIKTGRYGICEATGQQIPADRLEAIPWTRFTAEAERELERNNAAPRARLGELADLGAPSRTERDDEETGSQ
jgi:RNA polymerase-binding transcription factor DksA